MVRIPLVVRQGLPGGTRVILRWCLFLQKSLDQGSQASSSVEFDDETPSKLQRRLFFLVFNRIRGQNLICSCTLNAFGVTNWIKFAVVQEVVCFDNKRCLSGTMS